MQIRGNEVPVDVRAELEQFEWEKDRWTADQLMACSPFRSDSRPSFYVWLEDSDKAPAGAWGDRGGSGELEKGHFTTLLAFLRNESEEETIEYLETKYGVSNKDGEIVLRKLRPKLEKGARKTLDMSLLDGLEKHPYLSNRGIHPGVQHALKTGYDPEKRAIAIPWFLPDGRLASIKYRQTKSKKFFYAKGGFPVAKLLYGIHVLHQKEYLDHVVLTEAEIDSMSAMSVGFPAVAVGGSSFNEHHRSLLMQTNVKRIIVASDNDAAGEKLASQIVDSLGSIYDVYRVQFPNEYKDLNEVLVKNAKLLKSMLENPVKISGFRLF
jgi:5S rRNA maturation endonuclease (ribonuclease M5)